MHELLLSGLLAPCLIILLASSAVQGASGFGMAMVAVPLLTLFMSPQIAVPMMTLSSIVVTAMMIVRYRAHCDWTRAAWLGVPSLLLAPVGAKLLVLLPDRQLRIGLGVVLLASTLHHLLSTRRRMASDPANATAPRRASRLATVCVGSVSGVVGGALGMTGPLLADHLIKTGISREEFKITLNLIFLFSAVWKTLLYFNNHLLSGIALNLGLAGLPIALAGSTLGAVLSSRIKGQSFAQYVRVFLVVIGVYMLVSGVRGR